jgi:glycosyltransferase involved in cell wall biosynthesis
VGTIETRKNILLAVKTLHNIDTCLVIVGKETMPLKQKLHQKHNLEHKVIFLKGLTLEELAILYINKLRFLFIHLYMRLWSPIIEVLFKNSVQLQGRGFPRSRPVSQSILTYKCNRS